jgi:hypothetical protein
MGSTWQARCRKLSLPTGERGLSLLFEVVVGTEAPTSPHCQATCATSWYRGYALCCTVSVSAYAFTTRMSPAYCSPAGGGFAHKEPACHSLSLRSPHGGIRVVPSAHTLLGQGHHWSRHALAVKQSYNSPDGRARDSRQNGMSSSKSSKLPPVGGEPTPGA